MLQSLYIENAAVIKMLELTPDRGFTVLTGETGSGKSVIIDCLSFILGGKAVRDLVRSGEEKAVVSAVFGSFTDKDIAALNELGVEADEGEILVERTLSADGKSTCKINCRPVTKQQLCDVGKILVSLHSQDDTSKLESPKARLDIIDSAAGDKTELDSYKAEYSLYTEIKKKLSSLEKNEAEKEQLRDILTFQVKEISSAKLKADEDEKLEEEKKRIEGSEKLRKCTGAALKALSYNDKGITAPYLCDRAADALDKLRGLYPEYEALTERLKSAKYELDDIASEIETLANNNDVDFSVERIDAINSRLETINKLKRKYGPEISDVIAFGENAKSRLDEIENSDELKATLQKQLKAQTAVLKEKADKLTSIRTSAGKNIENSIKDILEYLDMPKVRFEVSVNALSEPASDGCDSIDFMLAANPGEPMLPLEKCASGGELSRVMLALRCAVSASDGTGTLVFDEIDTGISGKTSRKVGLKLLEVAKNSQVICVTHSAQIASLGESHLKISKKEVAGRTESSITALSKDDRIEEIARILGGINVTTAQRQAAVDMIENKTE